MHKTILLKPRPQEQHSFAKGTPRGITPEGQPFAKGKTPGGTTPRDNTGAGDGGRTHDLLLGKQAF